MRGGLLFLFALVAGALPARANVCAKVLVMMESASASTLVETGEAAAKRADDVARELLRLAKSSADRESARVTSELLSHHAARPGFKSWTITDVDEVAALLALHAQHVRSLERDVELMARIELTVLAINALYDIGLIALGLLVRFPALDEVGLAGVGWGISGILHTAFHQSTQRSRASIDANRRFLQQALGEEASAQPFVVFSEIFLQHESQVAALGPLPALSVARRGNFRREVCVDVIFTRDGSGNPRATILASADEVFVPAHDQP